MNKFGKSSRENFHRVHPDLILLCGRALYYAEVDYGLDFGIIDGARTIEEQKEYIRTGASTLKKPESSRHVISKVSGYAHAIDFMVYVNSVGRWENPLYTKVSKSFKKASKDFDIPIIWGGDWKSIFDGPHIELPHRSYK